MREEFGFVGSPVHVQQRPRNRNRNRR
ncbi:MAG: GTP-binding protein EngA [uncultured Nocardioides sp.]|uniref:GTP-binding protein EngA n=1 Tax=uncultured Nocardioides sp. TaxID=198441 RepID=A0A6J4PII8_9ACTN|nr:MAG: GTP-binding protein EngA [uncultured Nocardioides sp.]